MNRLISSSIRRNIRPSIRRFGAQPESQSQQAVLWQGHTTHNEGWESTVYATYFASTVLITLALGFAPDTSITTWASNEAAVRLEAGAVEFGSHSNVPEKVYDFDFQVVDNPFNEEDDDDDDDDDEDDEDDDEDEDEDDE